MSFASGEFIVFFMTVLCGAAFIERHVSIRAKEWFLIAASYFFYSWWDWRFSFLLLVVTLVSYIAGQHTENRAVFAAGVIVPLVVLGFFKYFNFFLSSFSVVLGRDIGTFRIILPVGISFYTFQALSYVIDVRRRKVAIENDFTRLALYLAFFPQLVAGPIVKAAEFLPQLYEKRHVTLENFKIGIQIFMFGMFKKIVLADHLSIFVDDVYAKPVAFDWATLILAAVSDAPNV